MPTNEPLNDRERQVLAAVVQTYIETAEPAGSQTLARRFELGIAPATIRSTMNDLEAKGYLTHPHTSAGRMPTDRAYRMYVNALRRPAAPDAEDRETLRLELETVRTAMDEVLLRAAQVLGVLTQELGVAAAPAVDAIVLRQIDLVRLASDRLLLVFNLESGVVRTIFVAVPSTATPEALAEAQAILNERLAGHRLAELRTTLPERLRDAGAGEAARDILHIFIAQGEELIEQAGGPAEVLLGSASLLVEQPEFATSSERMRGLFTLTERRDLLTDALKARRGAGLSVTIGCEHADPRLAEFTLVTSTYRVGPVSGVLGVLGPTRMPYDKIIGLVEHTSRMVEGLLS